MATMWALKFFFFPKFVPQMMFFHPICCKCHLTLIKFQESTLIYLLMANLLIASMEWNPLSHTVQMCV